MVDIHDTWKGKGRVAEAGRGNSFERIFVPASNVTREKEDGCLNKLKIERALQLRQDETKGRSFNIINGS